MGLTPPLSDRRRVCRRRQGRLEDARQAVRRADSRQVHFLLLVTLLAVRRVLTRVVVAAVPREHRTTGSAICGAKPVAGGRKDQKNKHTLRGRQR